MAEKQTRYGYMNAILRVDLSTGSIVKQSLDPDLARKYLGGMGWGARILYDELKSGVDPLGPDNILVFATGPLSGTMAPASCRTDVTFKAVTGMFGTANAGGFWGPELKYAGYDMAIIKGEASHPVYLWIDDDNVEIRSADHLWGQDAYCTTDMIKEELSPASPERVRIAAIGPAGENLVSFASLTVDYYNSASKCGIGAVMGAKKLKAIAVRGTNRVAVARPQDFLDAVKDCLRAIAEVGEGGGSTIGEHVVAGELPGKNFQVDTVPHWGELCADAEIKKTSAKVPHACYLCDRPCPVVKVTAGEHTGLITGNMHGSSLRGWGAACYLNNRPAIYKCHDTCQRLGLDYHGGQMTVAFAMELYQRGIISEKTTGGFRLEWGNERAVVKLLHDIARRQGFGETLADGPLEAARKTGDTAERYAMQIGGMGMGPHEPRLGFGTTAFDRSFVLGHLTSPRGGDNVKTTHIAGLYLSHARVGAKRQGEGQGDWLKQFVELVDVPEDLKEQIYGNPPRLDRQGYERKAPAMIFFEDLTTVYNSLGLCFMRRPGPTISARLLSALTGVEVTANELLKAGHRIFALAWAFNGREGITLNGLDFPERFYAEPIKGGPSNGAVLSREAVKKTMAEWYRLRGWDRERGLPTRKTLEGLGLKEVADDLEAAGF